MYEAVKYQFAEDDTGRLVNIDEVTEEFRRCHRYSCVSCGKEMVARLGEVNAHHFAHKGYNNYCDKETYFRETAKRLILQRFNEAGSLKISYKQNLESNDFKEYELTDYYNKCLIKQHNKKGYEDFRPDLMFCDISKEDRKPIFIEINRGRGFIGDEIEAHIRVIHISVKSEKCFQEFQKELGMGYIRQGEYTRYINFRHEKNRHPKTLMFPIYQYERYNFEEAPRDTGKSQRTSTYYIPEMESLNEALSTNNNITSSDPRDCRLVEAIRRGDKIQDCRVCLYRRLLHCSASTNKCERFDFDQEKYDAILSATGKNEIVGEI